MYVHIVRVFIHQKNVRPKTFSIRIVYNSNFKSLHCSQANTNIRKNSKCIGKTNDVQSEKKVPKLKDSFIHLNKGIIWLKMGVIMYLL